MRRSCASPLLLLGVMLIVLGTLAACRQPTTQLSLPPGPDDPQLLTLDWGQPSTTFDGGGGSLLLGTGWGTPERYIMSSWLSRRTVSFAWAIDGSSEVFFLRSTARPLDLVAFCQPFSYDGAEPQTMRVMLNDQPAGTCTLAEGWQDIRLELPSAAMTAGINTLRLEFSRSTQASDVGVGDERRLCAAFARLALVERGVVEPQRLLEESTFDQSHGLLTLPAGGAAAFPVPGSCRVSLTLGAVKSRCRGCTLSLKLWAPSGQCEEVFAASPATLDTQRHELDIPPGPTRMIVLRLEPSPSTAAGRKARVVIKLDVSVDATQRQAEHAQALPHIFIYAIDALRADAVTPYNPQHGFTPHIAELAADAVTYLDAWAPSTWTLPSTVSLLTGVYSDRHGIMQGNRQLRPSDHATMPALLADQGYETLAVSQSFIVSAAFGLDRGFDRFFFNNQLNGKQLRSERVRAYVLQWLLSRTDSSTPVFCYLHTVDPHSPYTPSGRFRRYADDAPGSLPQEAYTPSEFLLHDHGSSPREVAHLKALYDGEVAYADEQLGRFVAMLKYLGLYDSSMVVVLSDHGEEFGEHRGFDHGRTLYTELVNVPLIIKYPGQRWAGTTVQRRVSTLDLLPTIVELLGDTWQGPRGDGTSLAPHRAAGRDRPDSRLVFSAVNPVKGEYVASVDYRALALGRLKCIESLSPHDQFSNAVPRWQAFDLGADPDEQSMLSEQGNHRCEELLRRWNQERGDAGLEVQPGSLDTDEATHTMLQALGYVE